MIKRLKEKLHKKSFAINICLALVSVLFFVGYANGYMHYGAPEDCYNNGGYETIECMLDSGWLTEYEGAVKEILEEL